MYSNMKTIIEQKIKDKFKTKAAYARATNITRWQVNAKITACNNSIRWLRAFLLPLGLKVWITSDDGKIVK